MRQWKQWMGRIYAAVARFHRKWRSRHAQVSLPILVVGSLRAGGGGKTPVTMWLAQQFPESAVLAHPTGDEDQELGRMFPGRVFVGRNWQVLWQNAREAGFKTGICDGGYQDPWLNGAYKLLIWDEELHWGYEELLPMGPFRELPRAVTRANLILVANGSINPEYNGKRWSFSWQVSLPQKENQVVLLSCGVGRPNRVIQDLESLQIKVIGTHIVPDHGKFSHKVVQRMAKAHPNIPWVGTSKDAQRWPKEFPELVVLKRTWLPQESHALVQWLEKELLARQ